MTQQKPKVGFITVDDEFSGQRLDNFLLRELKGVPRSLVYKIVRSGEVRVNDGRAKAHNRLHTGDRIRIPPIRTSSRQKPKSVAGLKIPEIDILFEDEHLLIINKPTGLAVHAGSGLRTGLIEHLRATRPEDRFLELVHRLDRETSGCLMLAKRRSALRSLHEDLRQNSARNQLINKRYQALVHGQWDRSKKIVELPLQKNVERSGERIVVVSENGMYAKTGFRPLHSYADCTLIEATLYTGRTHQVRVHALASGHPILGDSKYPTDESDAFSQSIGLRRLFLHANQLTFTHPATQKKITITSNLPSALESTLGQVGHGESIQPSDNC